MHKRKSNSSFTCSLVGLKLCCHSFSQMRAFCYNTHFHRDTISICRSSEKINHLLGTGSKQRTKLLMIMPPKSLWWCCLEQSIQFWPLCLHKSVTELGKVWQRRAVKVGHSFHKEWLRRVWNTWRGTIPFSETMLLLQKKIGNRYPLSFTTQKQSNQNNETFYGTNGWQLWKKRRGYFSHKSMVSWGTPRDWIIWMLIGAWVEKTRQKSSSRQEYSLIYNYCETEIVFWGSIIAELHCSCCLP